MKIQIRQGVFETNSSSTHALCLGKKYNESQKRDIINFGVLTVSNYWSAKKDYQYRADILFAGIIGKYEYECSKAFSRLGKLIKLLTNLNITYSFNLDEDYIENDIPYVKDVDWVDTVLENEDNLMRYLFNDNSKYINVDRDELYRQGGWSAIIDKNKCDIYEQK